MCTYLNGKLVAYTGEIPSYLKLEVVPLQKKKHLPKKFVVQLETHLYMLPSHTEEHKLSPQSSSLLDEDGGPRMRKFWKDTMSDMTSAKNMTARVIGVGKRAPRARLSADDPIVIRCEKYITKYYAHHSDGWRGGKALYKDKTLRRAGHPATRAVNAGFALVL